MKKLSQLIGVLDKAQLFRGGAQISPDDLMINDIPVEGITYDSRKVKKDFIFACMPGFNMDGNEFVPDALKKGAGAVISNGKPDVPAGSVLVKVGDTRVSLGKLAAEFYDHPDRSLRVIGVTGTNGKTTTTYILRSILERHGKKAGLIGTIVYEAGGDSFPAGRTTPEASDIEFMFRHSADAGEEYAVIEVSSHSLMLHRVDAIEFDQAIFTNLGLDHLDFHQTKEEYLKAKMKLFQGLDRPGAKKDKRS